MDEREARIRRRLKDDFSHYAFKCLKIRTKAGEVVPLELNQIQRNVHENLEGPKAEMGRVRALNPRVSALPASFVCNAT